MMRTDTSSKQNFRKDFSWELFLEPFFLGVFQELFRQLYEELIFKTCFSSDCFFYVFLTHIALVSLTARGGHFRPLCPTFDVFLFLQPVAGYVGYGP